MALVYAYMGQSFFALLALYSFSATWPSILLLQGHHQHDQHDTSKRRYNSPKLYIKSLLYCTVVVVSTESITFHGLARKSSRESALASAKTTAAKRQSRSLHRLLAFAFAQLPPFSAGVPRTVPSEATKSQRAVLVHSPKHVYAWGQRQP